MLETPKFEMDLSESLEISLDLQNLMLASISFICHHILCYLGQSRSLQERSGSVVACQT